MNAIRFLALMGTLGAGPMAFGATGQSSFATLYAFNGDAPVGLTARNGVLYGATGATGYNCGDIFQLQSPPREASGSAQVWTETVFYTFTGINGDACEPGAAPVIGSNGVLYGTTVAGGGDSYGTVFEIVQPASPNGSWTESVLYSFAGWTRRPLPRPSIRPRFNPAALRP